MTEGKGWVADNEALVTIHNTPVLRAVLGNPTAVEEEEEEEQRVTR